MFLPTHASWYCFHRVAYLCLYRCLSLCISTKQKVVLVQTYLVVWNNIWLLRVFGRVCSFVCSAESAKCRDLWLVWYFVLFCSFLITVFLCLCFYAFVLCSLCLSLLLLSWAASTMDYSFLAARLSFTFIYICIFFSWQINSAAARGTAGLSNSSWCFCCFKLVVTGRLEWSLHQQRQVHRYDAV